MVIKIDFSLMCATFFENLWQSSREVIRRRVGLTEGTTVTQSHPSESRRSAFLGSATTCASISCKSSIINSCD